MQGRPNEGLKEQRCAKKRPGAGGLGRKCLGNRMEHGARVAHRQIGKGRGTAAETPSCEASASGGEFGALVRAGAPPLTVCAGRIGTSPMQLVGFGHGHCDKRRGMQLRLARSREAKLASTRKILGYLDTWRRKQRPHEPWPAGDVPLAKQLNY